MSSWACFPGVVPPFAGAVNCPSRRYSRGEHATHDVWAFGLVGPLRPTRPGPGPAALAGVAAAGQVYASAAEPGGWFPPVLRPRTCA